MEELCPAEESEEGNEDDGTDESDQESVCWWDWLADELPLDDSNTDDDEENKDDWYHARTVLSSTDFEPIQNIITRICRLVTVDFHIYFIHFVCNFLLFHIFYLYISAPLFLNWWRFPLWRSQISLWSHRWGQALKEYEVTYDFAMQQLQMMHTTMPLLPICRASFECAPQVHS